MLNKHLKTSLSALGALILASTMVMPAVASASHADDWASPRSIVHALHETISAGPGEQRDWDRYRDLFLDGAMVSMAIKSPRAPGIMAATTEKLIEQTEASYRSTGFHEIPLIVEVAEFGAMAVVTNSFEIKLRLNAAAHREQEPDEAQKLQREALYAALDRIRQFFEPGKCQLNTNLC